MFKKTILAATVAIFSSNSFAASSSNDFDLGIGYDLGMGLAAQFSQYSVFLGNEGLAFDVRANNFNSDSGAMQLYVDVGGYVSSNGDDDVGLRVPLGITTGLDKNVEVYIQAVPHLSFSNDLDFGIDGALGIRFRF